MSIIATLISKESLRNKNMIAEYEREKTFLHKGSITVKSVGNKTYYYLNYRNGKKIISKYIGKDEHSLQSIKEQLERRKQIEAILKKLKAEQLQLKKLESLL